MEQLLEQFQGFSPNTKIESLKSWAKMFERQIASISQNEKGYYYLVLSQLNALYLRNIQEGKSVLKKIRNPSFTLLQQIKLRRCFYKYLEGDYQNAIETLEQFIHNSNSPCSIKIAKDFFSRIYSKDNYTSFGKNQIKVNRAQSYQMDYLKAIKEERRGKFKMAGEIHKQIVQNYGDLDQAIEYQSAKHILLLVEKEGARPNREKMQNYMRIASQYEKKLTNKKYYSSKVDFLLKVMDLTESQSSVQEQTRKYQLAKELIVDKLKRALAAEQDQEIIIRLKSVLNALKESKVSGEEVCYKFLGDKQLSQLSQLQDKKKQSKMVFSQSKMKENSYRDQQQPRSKVKKMPAKQNMTQIMYDQEQEQEVEIIQSKLKKTPIKDIVRRQPDEDYQNSKLKSKINTQSKKSKMNRQQDQQGQEQENIKSNLKNQNKSKLRPQESQFQQYNLKSKSKFANASGARDMKQTDSRYQEQFRLNPDFEGSVMTKVNFNSGGHDQRYFYMRQDFQETMKLYYSSKKQKKSLSDEFYRIKGLKKITVGKKTSALKRSECEDFNSDLCFTLYISSVEEDYERNFYVKDREQYEQWLNVFKYILSKKDSPQNMRTKTRILMK